MTKVVLTKKVALTVCAAIIATAGLAAQTPPQAPPAAPKPAAAAAPAAGAMSPAGNWNISLDAGQGPMDIAVTFKVDGKKVTGSLSSPMGDTALEGEFAEGKLTFAIDFNGTPLNWAATMKDGDNFMGSLNGPMGEIPFVGKRVKG